ncbi:importin-5-like [Hordeum vulgare subsp. vulgare]|uniref:TOG domain-containing protein n=1 Tax=Hordeum vulgare subsp. vulgare TaxID=112509 RepID=A0A8I6Y4F2_HORVV|nr:importin-5-like [Hordeum vulgare subsp. vulgare]
MDPQAAEAVLGADPAPLTELLGDLASPANEARSRAERTFHALRAAHPDPLALRLAHLLLSPAHPSAPMAAVLLRRLISPGSQAFVYPSLAPATQSSLRALLLSAASAPGLSRSISRKLSDAVAELAAHLLPSGSWPDLLTFLYKSVASPSSPPALQESALNILARLASHLAAGFPNLHALLLAALSHPSSADVRVAGLNAAISVIQSLSSAADRDQFQDLLPAMMRALAESLNCGNEGSAQEALEMMIELAGLEPRFLRRQLPDVVAAMLQIAEAPGLEDGTRHLAVEFVVTLAEARERAPGMMRRLPRYVGRLFAIVMTMLLDVQDEPAWYAAVSEEEDAGETGSFVFAQECLDRLAIAVGGNTILPVAAELLPSFIGAEEWKRRHAALMTISQIAEGCAKVMTKNLDQVVGMVLNSFQDPHPRVRWAAINAVGQLSTDLGPELQNKLHHVVLPALASAMDDSENPRVQAHAASAILNFSENCRPEILTPYLDVIVGKLLLLLQSGSQMVQEGALTALASAADSSQEHFQKYYDAVMPYLKAILMNATDKSSRMLRAKSMECISLVGMAVGKQKFRDDAKQVMEVLMSLQGSHMEADDPITSYMLQAWARLCKCLGQEFLPYMSVVMPPLLQSAQLKPDVSITSADEDGESDDDGVETITLGDKRIGIRTSLLEEKATACSMLCCYADELKEGFFPWIDQVATTLVPLLKFYFHDEVRKAAVSAMPELLRSAKLAVEKGQAQGRDDSYLKQLSDYIVPALVEAMHKEPETQICASILESLNESIQMSGTLLDEGQVRYIVEGIKEVITASSNRRTERTERANAEDFDSEEDELLREENEQEDEIFDQVGDCLGTLVKTFKSYFLPFFDELSVYLTPMLGKDKTSEERRVTICIFDDVAEHCREAAVRYYDTYLPSLLEACASENPDVRQAAVYGIGICAEFGGSAFRPHTGEALSRLYNVIKHPNALDLDNAMAYDNSVSALGKICQFHRDSIDASQVIPAWLSCLPLKNDLVEAKIVHEQMCAMLEKSDSELLGHNNQHLPKIVSTFAEILCAGKDLATEQTASKIVNLLRQLQTTLPPSVLASTWSTLQPQQQLALQSVLTS